MKCKFLKWNSIMVKVNHLRSIFNIINSAGPEVQADILIMKSWTERRKGKSFNFISTLMFLSEVFQKSQKCVKATIAFVYNNCKWQLLYATNANDYFCMHYCNWQLLFVLLQVTTIVSTIAVCMHISSSTFL